MSSAARCYNSGKLTVIEPRAVVHARRNVSGLKTKPTNDNVMEFVERVADGNRRADCLTIIELMRDATQAEPVLWGTSIIGFGRYRYRYASGREGEWPVVGFSPRKNDLTLYIMPGFDSYESLMSRLGKHRTGKSCLYIKRLADVDQDVLATLIQKSVAAMSAKRVDE